MGVLVTTYCLLLATYHLPPTTYYSTHFLTTHLPLTNTTHCLPIKGEEEEARARTRKALAALHVYDHRGGGVAHLVRVMVKVEW